MRRISDIINDLMNAKHMTQVELAIKSDTTEATISRYLNNERPIERNKTVLILCNMADALDVSLDELLGRPERIKGLNPNEQTLLNCFKKATPKEQKAILAILDEYK